MKPATKMLGVRPNAVPVINTIVAVLRCMFEELDQIEAFIRIIRLRLTSSSPNSLAHSVASVP